MKKISLLEASRALFSEIESTSPQISKIKHYLSEGADINYQSEKDGYTALMLAVDKNDEPLVAYLLQEGANPLIQNHHHEIASSLASSHSTIYQILKNYELLLGAQQNDINTVNAALDAGANINFQRKDGYTAILIAVEKNLLKMVELLLKKGADISLKDNVHRGVFDLVTEDSIWELLRRERPLHVEDTIFPWQKEGELREQARLKAIAAKEGKPFVVSQLKILPMGTSFSPTPTEKQLSALEHHFRHPLPPFLKEIFTHYNGGRPTLDSWSIDQDNSISYFYDLDENIDASGNIWKIINGYSKYLGSETLPFAEDDNGGIYYLKWEDDKAKVWLFLYGGDLVSEDEDDGEDTLPTAHYPISDSLEDFLEALYEAK